MIFLLPLTTTVTCLSSIEAACTLYFESKFSVNTDRLANSLLVESSNLTLTVRVLELTSVIPFGFLIDTLNSLSEANLSTSTLTSICSVASTAS